VSDTGKGIPADKLETIFEEYVQLDSPARVGDKGLGLGLAIVKHIVNILGHRIEVTSILGKGSTFSVEIPG
jgi:signal transduction histidine kinase